MQIVEWALMGMKMRMNTYVVADVGRVEPVWTTGLVCTTHALFRYRAYLRNDFRVVALERNKHCLSSTGHVYTA